MVMAAVMKSISYEFPFVNTNGFQVLNCMCIVALVCTNFVSRSSPYIYGCLGQWFICRYSKQVIGQVCPHPCYKLQKKRKALGILTHHG